MQHRPLALVSVLAVGDYLLWNWSLQGSHDVLALISGLTLVLLVIALIWLVALNAARLLTGAARRRTDAVAQRGAGRARTARRPARTALRTRRGVGVPGVGGPGTEVPTGANAQTAGATAAQQRKGGEPASSSKLAA